MAMLSTEELMAAHKSNVETLLGLTGKTFEGVEKLVELNLQVARAAMTEAADNMKTALSVKDVQTLMAMQAGLLQPAAEKAAAYSRHLYEIMAATQAEVGKVAGSRMSDAQSRLLTAIDGAAKNAPAGTENAVAMMKSAVAGLSTAFDGVQKAVKQAGNAAGANFHEMNGNAVRATHATSGRLRRGV